MAAHHPAAVRAGAARPAGPAGDPRDPRGGPAHQRGRDTEGTWLGHRHGLDPGCRRRHLPDTRRREPARRRPAALPGLHAARSAAGQLPAAAARAHADLCPAAVRPGEPDVGPNRQPHASSPSRWPPRPAARSAGRSPTVPPWRRGRARDRRRHVPTGPPDAYGTLPPSDGAPPSILGWHGAAGGARQLTFNTGHDPSVAVELSVSLAPGAAIGQVAITAQPPSRSSRPSPPAVTWRPTGSASDRPSRSRSAGLSVTVQIVASVANFPTVFGQNRALIADLAEINDLLAANQADALAGDPLVAAHR